VDRPAHKRFLEYLEMFPYFKKPGEARLDVDSWKLLDAELVALLGVEKPDEETRRRIQVLRRALLRD
jgi:hypothetical protein